MWIDKSTYTFVVSSVNSNISQRLFFDLNKHTGKGMEGDIAGFLFQALGGKKGEATDLNNPETTAQPCSKQP